MIRADVEVLALLRVMGWRDSTNGNSHGHRDIAQNTQVAKLSIQSVHTVGVHRSSIASLYYGNEYYTKVVHVKCP